MDKNTKGKVRRKWLVIGLVASTALGIFFTQIPIVYNLHKKAEVQAQTLKQKQTLKQELGLKLKQAFQYQFMLLGISALCFMLMPLLLLNRNQIFLFLKGQLIIFLPKEAFHQQIHKLRRVWWEPLVIGLFLFTASGFFIQRLIIVYSLMDQQGVVLPLMQASAPAVLAWEQEPALVSAQITTPQEQQLQNSLMLLGISALSFILMLWLLLRQQNQTSLTLIGQLGSVLLEEHVADLGNLYQEIKSKESSIWIVRGKMFKAVIEVIWAYVQIIVENLWRP